MDAKKKHFYAYAFSELIAYIEDTSIEYHDKNSVTVFILTDPMKLYCIRFSQLCVTHPYVYSTRFNNQILANFPKLRAFKE